MIALKSKITVHTKPCYRALYAMPARTVRSKWCEPSTACLLQSPSKRPERGRLFFSLAIESVFGCWMIDFSRMESSARETGLIWRIREMNCFKKHSTEFINWAIWRWTRGCSWWSYENPNKKKTHSELILNGLLVEIVGVEPTTLCLQSRCSSQLSYTPFLFFSSVCRVGLDRRSVITNR